MDFKVADEKDKQGGGDARHGGGVFKWVWVVGLTLVLYVGSVGPVCRLRDAGFVTTGTMAVVYAPLILASEAPPGTKFLPVAPHSPPAH